MKYVYIAISLFAIAWFMEPYVTPVVKLHMKEAKAESVQQTQHEYQIEYNVRQIPFKDGAIIEYKINKIR